jgi:hypothetical protein
MQVHESAGTEWFNKECFEELMEWFSITELMEGAVAKPAPRTISARLGRLAAELLRIKESAAHAGYRSQLLLRLLAPVTAPPPKKAPAAATKTTARKKADVQSSPRKNTAKAPHNKVSR